MNRYRHLHIILIVGCVARIASAEIDFAHDVVPILKKHCAECHTGRNSEGGFSFNTLRLLQDSGYAATDGSHDSRIVELIRSRDPDDQMPPKDRDRLSVREVETLRQWIQAKTPWEPGFRFGQTGYEPPLLPRVVRLPPASFPEQNPVDRILAEYAVSHHLPELQPVHDDVWLRRVYLDLIGLLPTIQERETYLQDTRDNRRELLVDELLNRRHDYAEHWVSFWNDLLRNDYAGTGYIDGGRKQITQWLYRSLVHNKAYDQFVRELIAPTDESSGFINGIQWRGSVNASQVREVQFAQNVSQVFLGINMKCASCHDSFIDRWTLDEAYGLAAVYSTRPLEVHRCDKPTGRMAKAEWIFPEIGSIDASSEQPERLRQLAALMTSPRNGRFARTIVNRLWHRLMGHGIVHPVDAMHTEPWSGDLLDYLANFLVEQKHDVKQVLRLIATSQAYQSMPAPATDSATSEEFVFRGPVARHLTAEQFMDCVWRLTDTAPAAINADIPATDYYGNEVPDVKRVGKWIWSYAEVAAAPAGEQVSFLRTIELDQVPSSADVVITCDNEYTLFVNGVQVAADRNWPTVETIDVRQHLTAGKNEILIFGRNAGNSPNAAALYAELLLTDSSGNRTRIATDEMWSVSSSVPVNEDISTVEWQPAVAVTPQNFLGPGAEAAIKAELSGVLNGKHRIARASLMKSDLLMRSLGRPNREQVVTTRPSSLSTLQAIDLANGSILNDLLASGAAKMASRSWTSTETFVADLYRRALSREPSAQELDLCLSVLGDTPTADSIQDLLWIIVMLPEFQFVQ